MGRGRWEEGEENGPVMGQHKQDRNDKKREMVLRRRRGGKIEVVRGEWRDPGKDEKRKIKNGRGGEWSEEGYKERQAGQREM